MTTHTLAFGGGCHWCTEAVFQALHGVTRVEQGWLASTGDHAELSEGVIVHYDPDSITPSELLFIHLHTHASTATHSMRETRKSEQTRPYRSAAYYFQDQQHSPLENALKDHQQHFDKPLITQILPYHDFEASPPEITNYYQTRPDKPFSKKHIEPKLQKIKELTPHLIK